MKRIGRPPRDVKERFLDSIEKRDDGCWIWVKSCFRDGYGQFAVKGKNRKAHRVAWELFKGPIPEGLSVLHRCHVPRCTNPEHLYIGDHDQNMKDRLAVGRYRGAGSPNRKLTLEQVAAIRTRARSGESVRAIAKDFPVGKSNVDYIIRGATWRATPGM